MEKNVVPEESTDAISTHDVDDSKESLIVDDTLALQDSVDGVRNHHESLDKRAEETSDSSVPLDAHTDAASSSSTALEQPAQGAGLGEYSGQQVAAAAVTQTPLQTSVAAPKRAHVGKIVAVIVLVLVVVCALGVWVANKAVAGAFEDKVKTELAQTTKVDRDYIHVAIDGKPRLIQMITGKYEHIAITFDGDILLTSLASLKDTPALQDVSVEIVGLDTNTMTAQHVVLNGQSDAASVESTLRAGMESESQGMFEIHDLKLNDGGFQAELGMLGLDVPAVMKMDVGAGYDGQKVKLDIRQATIEAYGQSFDVTEEMQNEMIANSSMMELGLLRKAGLRYTQCDFSPDGIRFKMEGDQVNLNSF